MIAAFAAGHSSGFYGREAAIAADQARDQMERDVSECLVGGDAARTAACVEQVVRRARDDARAEHDLDAQRSMARWAFWLLIAALVQLPVSIASLIFLALTIRQGRASLLHAQNASQTQLRPYIFPGSAKVVHLTGSQWIVEFEAKNSGLTPAEVVEAWLNVEYVQFPIQKGVPRASGDCIRFPNVAQRSRFRLSATINISKDQLNAIRAERAGILCVLRLRYQPFLDSESTEVEQVRIVVGEDLRDGVPSVVQGWMYESNGLSSSTVRGSDVDVVDDEPDVG